MAIRKRDNGKHNVQTVTQPQQYLLIPIKTMTLLVTKIPHYTKVTNTVYNIWLIMNIIPYVQKKENSIYYVNKALSINNVHYNIV